MIKRYEIRPRRKRMPSAPEGVEGAAADPRHPAVIGPLTPTGTFDDK
jgi:hypothetical protein